MPNKKNKRVIVLISLFLFIFGLFLACNPKTTQDVDKQNLDQIETKSDVELPKNPKTSGSWIVDYIHIKNDNWSATDLPWIQNRTGSYQDPHVIENVTINGLNKTTCILIESSSEHFIIRNCTLYNSSKPIMDTKAGIRLSNIKNGILVGNNCSYNNGNGITFNRCDNITLLENIVNNNLGYGIESWQSTNITCSGNIAKMNNASGILLMTCANNSIYRNIAINNTIDGFLFAELWNSDIFENNAMDNAEYGMELKFNAQNNTVYNNVFIGNMQGHALTQSNPPNNKWDNGIIGNYWDNYTEKGGVDNNNDGIGDLNYIICDFGGGPAANDTKPIYENPKHYGEKVHIDDTGVSALNWSQTELVKWWCEGSGIESNPYDIRDLVINGSDSGNCILIENSNVYFNIENCTVFNSGTKSSDYSGIKLVKTNYSTIINNDCSDNQGHGILFYDNCDNNTIIGNTVNSNYGTGIRIEGNNNNISNNICVENQDKGLTCYGDYNNISGNYFFNNTFMMGLVGIFDYGNYTILSENTLEKNNIMLMGWYAQFHRNRIKGARLDLTLSLPTSEELYSHTISDTNTVNDGILYYYKNEIGLTNANFTNAGQIILLNCNDSLISEVSISNNSGIELKDSYRNKILNVNLSDCSQFDLYQSHQNFISKCIFINNSNGISLSESYNNTIFNNLFEDNSNDGIRLSFSHYNNITKNLIINSAEDGIQLESSNFTVISDNKIYNNENGIKFYPYCLETLSFNNVTNNIIENNEYGMSLLASANNIFRDNLIKNSSIVGINANCDNNLFYRNAFIENNISHVWDEGNSNKWDNGIIGNYWDNYTERGGIDNNNDGIGDINYTVYDSNGIPAANDTKPIYENPKHYGEKIYIDDTGVSALNWSQTALVKWWCTGSGEEHKPYIIKNLFINGSGTGNCIFIANSSIYFTVENCTVFNCDPSGGAGIRLESVNNSLIIGNNCSDNNYGIILSKCYNNLIHDNSMFKKGFGERYGIHIEYSNENNITNNLIFDFSGNSYGSGIDLFLSNYSIVKNNIVFNHRDGISIIFTGIHNYFSENIIYNNSVGLVIKGEDNTANN